MNHEMTNKILKIKADNPTFGYAKIAGLVGCSKSFVKYVVKPGEKIKTRDRVRKRRSKHTLVRRLERFNNLRIRKNQYNQVGKKGSRRASGDKLELSEVIDKIGNDPRCYLTGRPIDLDDTSSYHFDHKIPRSKGGDSSLNNLGLACREANLSKRDMSVEEYLLLCKEVLENNGFVVSKKF